MFERFRLVMSITSQPLSKHLHGGFTDLFQSKNSFQNLAKLNIVLF